MLVNIVRSGEKILCSKCENPVDENDNFCRVCGNPLTKEAVVLKRERNFAIKVETAREIAEVLKDPKILEYVENLKK